MLSYETIIEKRRCMLIGLVLAACAALVLSTALASKAKAGTSWTGCGAGLHGGLVTGNVAFGNTHVGQNGESGGVTVFCDYQMQAMVAGLYVEGDAVWGDLHTSAKVNYDLTVGARVGLLASQQALLYSALQYTRIYTGNSGANELDAVGLGGGIEVKIKGTPASVDLRYMHLWVDNKPFGSGVDVTADTVRLGLNFKLSRDLQPVNYDDTPEPAGCDPKFANCHAPKLKGKP